MTDPLITITRAAPSALDEILSLLQRVDLPSEGVADYLDNFLAAKTHTGKIVGCVGLEPHGRIGLLRSAAVHPEYRGLKIGTRLVSSLLSEVREQNYAEIILLTSTAQDFFARTFGFREAKRWRYNKRLQDSPEWNLPRCSSAVLMKLKLQQATEAPLFFLRKHV